MNLFKDRIALRERQIYTLKRNFRDEVIRYKAR